MVAQNKVKLTIINRDKMHTRVRVASWEAGQYWATNGLLTFTHEEWKNFKDTLKPDSCEIAEEERR